MASNLTTGARPSPGTRVGAAPPAVSVLIPCHNYGRFLPQALESVLGQTVKPLEIVVADDGSTDDTAAVAARYAPAVQYRRFEHAGVYAVRQALLGELRGAWFLNVDADDWIDPDFLERALAVAARHGDDGRLAFVYPDLELFGAEEGVREKPEFDAARLKRGNYVVMSSLIRLDAAREAGFDAQFNDGWGDYDFFLSLVERGYTGARMAGSRLHYRIHGDSITRRNPDLGRRERLMRRIVAKHAGFFSPAEAAAAVAEFAPNRELWRRLDGLRKARRYGAALRLALRTACTRPAWLRPPGA
jgi:glycosyltransferase involved in cell wall biosynthesis